MTTRHHVRNGSSGRKLLQQQQHNRSTRPAPLSRRTTSNGNLPGPLSPSTATSPTSARRCSRGIEIDITYTNDLDDYDSMASFLQFCPTCERQILAPSISVLYCSEACRRRDSAKSITHHQQYSPPLSPYSSAMQDHPATTIVPRRSPTVLHPITTTFSELSLYELNPQTRPSYDDEDESTFGMPTQSVRPFIERNHSSDDSAQLPSLVHSPSSSYGTMPSHIEAARPLPRKHSCPTSKGIDLVTPIANTYVQASVLSTGELRRNSAPIAASKKARASGLRA